MQHFSGTVSDKSHYASVYSSSLLHTEQTYTVQQKHLYDFIFIQQIWGTGRSPLTKEGVRLVCCLLCEQASVGHNFTYLSNIDYGGTSVLLCLGQLQPPLSMPQNGNNNIQEFQCHGDTPMWWPKVM